MSLPDNSDFFLIKINHFKSFRKFVLIAAIFFLPLSRSMFFVYFQWICLKKSFHLT